MSSTFSRRTLLAAAGATALLGAAGCAADRSDVVTVASSIFRARNSVNPTTGRPVRGLDSVLGAFRESHPDLRIELIDINAPSSNAVIAKTQTLLMSNAVDIIHGNTLWPYFEQGLLADLTEPFARDHWRDNYIDAILTPSMERFTYPAWDPDPQIQISVPGDLSTLTLAYVRQLFDDFGVEPLGTIPTIEEILDKAKRLTGKNPRTGEDCHAIGYDPRAHAHVMLFYLGRGVDFGRVDRENPAALTLDTPEVKRGIEEMIALAPYCPPGVDIGQGLENWGTAKNTTAIRMVAAPGDMQKAVDNSLVERYVVTEGLRDREGHTFFVSGSEWAISSTTPNPAAAWELVKYLSGPVGQQLAFANTLTLPSWRTADWVDPRRQPYAAPFTAAAEAGRNAFFPQFMFTTFRPWIAKTVSLALNGQQPDLSAGLADMQRKGEQWVLDSTRPKEKVVRR